MPRGGRKTETWTEEEKAFVQYASTFMSDEEVARHLSAAGTHRTKDAVQMLRRQVLGIKKLRGRGQKGLAGGPDSATRGPGTA